MIGKYPTGIKVIEKSLFEFWWMKKTDYSDIDVGNLLVFDWDEIFCRLKTFFDFIHNYWFHHPFPDLSLYFYSLLWLHRHTSRLPHGPMTILIVVYRYWLVRSDAVFTPLHCWPGQNCCCCDVETQRIDAASSVTEQKINPPGTVCCFCTWLGSSKVATQGRWHGEGF